MVYRYDDVRLLECPSHMLEPWCILYNATEQLDATIHDIQGTKTIATGEYDHVEEKSKEERKKGNRREGRETIYRSQHV